jgi:non-specific serine/threonine protein kinase
LSGGSRTALPRHQTLRAALQWSYDLLLPPEAELLRALAAFSGGWTLGTCTAIAMEHGDEFEVLDLLTRLADKSLIAWSRDEKGEPRYRLLESVRALASERLAEAGEEPRARGRHFEYFLAMAESGERELRGPDQKRWFATLEAEHDNLLVAFAWAPRVEDGAAKGLRMASSIASFWSALGHFEIGRRVLEEALRRDMGSASAARATALVRAGSLALSQGDTASARPRIEESLALYRELGDAKGVARASIGLATAATYQGDFAAARRYGEEALARYRELGEKRGAAACLHNLGYMELCQGDLVAARDRYQQALALMREVQDLGHVAYTLSDLAIVAVRDGRAADAVPLLREALRHAAELGDRARGVYALDATAELAAACGHAERAARLCLAAAAVREEIGAPLVPIEQRVRDQLLARVRGALTPQRWAAAAAWEGGRDFGVAVAYAREWLEEADPVPS